MRGAPACNPLDRPFGPGGLGYRFDSTSSGLDESIKGYVQSADTRRGARLRCRACGHAITEDAERVSVSGSHVHTRSNPAGIQFCFGCFQAAPGCASVGPPTGEYTWFPGCRWRIAVCSSCGDHLGWSFTGGQRFFGLILARLVRDGDDAH